MTTAQVLYGSLLAFATWTIVVLVSTIGLHRWHLILTRRAAIHEFPPHAPNGPDWYRRATRAHLNCVENLPVFGAIVVAAVGAGAHGRGVELAAIAVPCARVVQTVVHVAFAESARTVTVRFSFFAIQILAFFALIVRVVHP